MAGSLMLAAVLSGKGTVENRRVASLFSFIAYFWMLQVLFLFFFGYLNKSS